MYNPIYNQLYLVDGHNCNIWRLWDVLMGKSSILILYNSGWWLTYPSEKYESQLGL